MAENKTIIFDMDGTIANFYGVSGWLENLNSENVRPYVVAKPLVDVPTLNSILGILKSIGWKVVVTTWLAKDSSEDFKKVTRQAKLDWLNRYNFPYDEIHLVAYGTTKANCTRRLGGRQILVDDNEKVRKGFENAEKGRYTIDATTDIIKALSDLLIEELEK